MRRYDGETLIKKLDSSLKKKREFYVVALRLAGLDEIASKYGYEVNNKIEQMIYAFLADNSSKKDVLKGIDKALEKKKNITYKLNEESKDDKKPIYDIYYKDKK